MSNAAQLIIDRKQWIRGADSEDAQGNNSSFLLRESDQKMCCLGFYGRLCGIAPNALLNQLYPRSVLGYPDWLTSVSHGKRLSSEDARQLMDINDDCRISECSRELQIAAVFAKHDVQVEFVG